MTWWAAALAAITLVRLVAAAVVPLAPDETYYWVWSHALAPGYLDHPPMVALWIRAGTMLAGQTALGVRLLGPLAAALASWMLFDAARALFADIRVGAIAVLLLNGTLLLGVGTVIMTPDSPLLFFWTAGLWAASRLAAGGGGGWWLAAGIFGGLALDSKYTALFLWIGIGLWVLLVPAARMWLRRWQPWAACLLGFLLFSPVLIWNQRHGWAGFIKQGGRVDDWRPARAIGFLGELIGGQIGLATPLIFALCMAGLAAACRHAWRQRDPRWSLLLALSLPPILVFVQHAMGDRVQGNWPAIIYPALVIAAAHVTLAMQPLVEKPKSGAGNPVRMPAEAVRWSADSKSVFPAWVLGLLRSWRSACLLGLAITALAYLQAATRLVPLPPNRDPVAIRLAGWDSLARQTATMAGATGASFVAVEGYALGSELAWLLPVERPLVGVDAHWAFINLPRPALGGRIGLLVRDERNAAPPDSSRWTDAERIGTVLRPGVTPGRYAVYRVTGTASQDSAASLPRR
ncbi:MAG TPA: glycosyltransferase family 39 protein [Rhodopila sp.]|nr:glycosyltransferase family 39 protein [Rhodopila sp.]